MRLIRLVAVFAVAALALTSSALAQATAKDRPKGSFTYEQIRAMGLPLEDLPAKTGLPPCPLFQSVDHGYRTIEEAKRDDANAARAPMCAARPEAARYGVGLTAPIGAIGTPGYHHTGHITWNKVAQGIEYKIEVGNPTVDHRSDCSQLEFVAARVFSQTSQGKWTETGISLETLVRDSGHDTMSVWL